MKLAEALSERADIMKRIQQTEMRLCENARVQEGEKPAEDPYELMEELERLTSRLEELVSRINLTNAKTVFEGVTLTELLSKRDAMTRKLSVMRDFLNEANSVTNRSMRTEIKIFSTVPVAELRKKQDEEAKALRELDVKIQSLNWSVELI